MRSPRLTTVLDALGAELDDMAAASLRLQGVIGDLAARSPTPLDDGQLRELQAADALAQRLEALAGLLHGLGRDPESDLGAALAAMPLSDLAARLGCDTEAAAPQMASAGDCELF